MTQFDETTEIMNGSKRDIWKLFHSAIGGCRLWLGVDL